MSKENIFKRGWNNFIGFFKGASTDNLYLLDGCVPPHKAFLFGLQHILAMFVANLAPILVLLAADGLTLVGTDKTSILQNALFIAGIGTIVQLYPIWRFGGRLPIVVGVSFTFVGMLSFVAVTYGYGTMIGSLIVGGIFIAIMGIFAKYWKRFIKPIVSSLVVLAIGLSLLAVGGDYFAGGAENALSTGIFAFCSWQSLTVASITFIACLLFQIFIKGSWKNLSTLFGIVVGYLVSLLFNLVDGTAIDFSVFNNVQVFSFPKPYDFGEIRFNIAAILPVCLIFLVASTEGIGDVTATCKEGLGRLPTDREISGALACDGLVSGVSACFGCLPLTTFSQNVGIVGQTKIVNRFTILLGAFVLILAGLFPPVAVAIQTIPKPVLGGALTMLFASIVVSGIKMFAELGFTPKNILILTISLGVGYGFSLVGGFYSSLGKVAENILSNPVAMIFLLSLILSYVIPDKWGMVKPKEEVKEEVPKVEEKE